MIIWFLCFIAVAWTTGKCEPPVNSYLPPAGSFGNNNRPSQEYGQPGAPNQDRISGFGRTGSQNQPQDSYSPIGQQPPASPNSQYGTPGRAGGPSPNKGFSSQKPNQDFGRPNSPDQEYGAPNQFRPNEDFRGQNSFSTQGAPNNRGRPGMSGGDRNGFGQDNVGPKQKPNSSYGPPSNQDRAPKERNGDFGNNQGTVNSYSPSQRNQQQGNRDAFQQPESSYGPPPVGNPRDNNFIPQAQGQRNDVPQTPSSMYSSPQQDNNKPYNERPSTSYGIPQLGGSRGSFGDNDDGQSNEPAKYEFTYDVDDSQTGTLFGHSEQRDGDTAMGMYNVVLPDGRKQVVEYEAGRQGYKPQIRYEGGNKGGQASSFGSGTNQGNSEGYPRGSPNNIQRNSGIGGYQTELNTPNQYQQQPESKYPGVGPEGFSENEFNKESGQYPGQQSQTISRGTSQNEGYSSNEPQRGRQFNNEDIPNGRGGYPQNSPRGQKSQESGNLGGDYPSSGNQQASNSFGGRGSEPGNRFSSSSNEGYPRGGPVNQQSQNPHGGGRHSDRGPGASGEAGYPARGGPDGPRGSGY